MNASADPETPLGPQRPFSDRIRRAGLLAILLALVALPAAIRISLTLGDANFHRDSPERMFKSDPALLYYFVERIVDSGGFPPDDFHADPRIEHPETRDIPAMFTIGQEFVVSWSYLAFGSGVPLHVFTVILMAIIASLTALGVFGLTYELTGKARWAVFAGLLYAFMPANYRTLGAILIREDLSLPCFALHLYLLARAVRLRTITSIGLAAVALVLALSTWHAMRFIVTAEALCILAWALRTGKNPLEDRRTWIFPVLVLVGARFVPILSATDAVWSLPVLSMNALWLSAVAAPWLGPRWRIRDRPLMAVAFALLCALAVFMEHGRGDDRYAHVGLLAWEKLAHLGQMPVDPALLSFDVRLLWQGPFETATFLRMFGSLVSGLIILLVALFVFARQWRSGPHNARVVLLVTFAAIACLAAYFVQRLLILPGFIAPVLTAVLIQHTITKHARAWGTGLLLVHLGFFAEFAGGHWVTWYERPQQDELAQVIDWVREHVPPDEAIATDLVTGPALLAHTYRPILMQPKYESAESRLRIRQFLEIMFQGSMHDLRRWLRSHRCQYLAIDRETLWLDFRYVGGLPLSASAPHAGTPAAVFLGPAAEVEAAAQGFSLKYQSPTSVSDGRVRIYRLAD